MPRITRCTGAWRALAAHTGITPHNVYTTWGPQAPAAHGEHPGTDDYAVDTAAAPLREPGAWVTLPATWLMSVNLRGPLSAPTNTRLKANVLGYAATYVNDVASDVTATEVKEDGHGLINWSTEVEGWLYDRPFALWGAYLQTDDLKWLRRAHRASQYYASWVAIDYSHAPYQRGAFIKKPPDYVGDGGDAKYSLAGGLYADYLLRGDVRLLARISAIGEFLGARVSTRLFKADKTNGLWTERHLGAAIAGALYAYEATGEAVFKARITQIIAGMQADVSSPPAGYPSAAQMQGVLLHRPEVHEGDSYADWIMSPWMSALLCESLWHYYLLSDDRVALQFIGDYAEFVAEKGLYRDSTDAHLSAYWAPWYIAGLKQGHTDNGINDDVEHAPDVLGLLARGRYARTLLGQPTVQIERQIANLRATRDFALGNWLRDSPGLPRYRLSPTRKFAWWYGTTYDLGWLGVSD